MAYKVVVTPPANHRLEMYVGYTIVKLKNPEAARSILKDAVKTKNRLADVADTLQICANPVLAKYEYRKMHFLKHDFVMIYRIDDNKVVVDGMYHELQDWESLFINDMKLT